MASTERTIRPRAVPISTLNRADWNPRTISRDRLDNLKRSVEADPDFMWMRPILATKDGEVYAGNQRLQACIELGWTDVPAILADVPDALAKQRATRDNNQWGEWDEEALEGIIAGIYESDPDAPKTLGFTDEEITNLLLSAGVGTTDRPYQSGDGGVTYREPSGRDGEEPEAPSEFKQYDADIQTEYKCPSCSYEWSGRAK